MFKKISKSRAVAPSEWPPTSNFVQAKLFIVVCHIVEDGVKHDDDHGGTWNNWKLNSTINSFLVDWVQVYLVELQPSSKIITIYIQQLFYY